MRYPDVPSYTSAIWRRLRADHLRREPLCRYCAPFIVPGYAVDHVTPHRGDPALFFDPDNLQTLCITHHNATKLREEIIGFAQAVDADGKFVDPRHPWGSNRVESTQSQANTDGDPGRGDQKSKCDDSRKPPRHEGGNSALILFGPRTDTGRD